MIAAPVVIMILLVCWYATSREKYGAEHSAEMHALGRTVPPSAERNRQQRALMRLELAEGRAERERLLDNEPSADVRLGLLEASFRAGGKGEGSG